MAMATWIANDASSAHANVAINCLELAAVISEKLVLDAHWGVLYVESLAVARQFHKAKTECLRIWNINKNVNLALAMSNLLADDPEQLARSPATRTKVRLEWINWTLKRYGLSPMTLADTELTLDSLCGSTTLPVRRGPLISIVMPVFNCENYLDTAVSSIRKQSWQDWELIIVDDASTDRSVAIANKLAAQDSRIIVIGNSTNRGIGATRCIALSKARGEFVTSHDADDWSHPEKLDLQVSALLRNDAQIANMSEHVRCTTDMRFNRRGRPGYYVADNYSSLMFRRQPVLDGVGYWDTVRAGEDSEYITRIEAMFGKHALGHLRTGPLLMARLHDQSSTASSEIGYGGYIYGARAEYNEAAADWLERSDRKIPFLGGERAFAAPNILRSVRVRELRFDVIIASDFRLEGGSTVSCAEEIKAQTRAGLRTGLVHIPKYEHNPDRKIDKKIRELVNGKTVEMVCFGETAFAEVGIFRWPPALADRCLLLPSLKVGTLKVIYNQSDRRRTEDEPGSLYSVTAVDKEAQRLFGAPPVWHPIGPTARSYLEVHSGDVNVDPNDWVNVIDLNYWRRRPARPRNPIPHIGRHARDHWDKWPSNPDEVLRVYPKSADVVVSILGGADVPKHMLGTLPANWRVNPFNNDPREYLTSLDVFVYFPHAQWIEAFGRTIIEAMAVGVPVVLPDVFEPVFGNGALYATADTAMSTTRALLQDDNLYDAQVERGRAYVEDRHAADVHIRRLVLSSSSLRRSG
jgi:glycosyltransferase involved in cell wall biosynthesis